MSTQRLYYDDSHLLEFTAQVVSVIELEKGRRAVELDRTAFYPTGGGQPCDTGILNDARVTECIETSDDSVIHIVEPGAGDPPRVGDAMAGRVDFARRRDHIQQHTGQHILSQSFVALFEAETRSFRMLDEVCEIDVALDSPTDTRIEDAVNLANTIIWDNRPVQAAQVTPEEAAQLPLRKDPGRPGLLRVVEVAGFDLTPCGGTHAKQTGEVGMLAVRSWSRAKGLTRVEFVAGVRLHQDYRRANGTARHVAALFSVARDETPESVVRLREENKELLRRVRELEHIAARVEAANLLANTAPRADGLHVVTGIFPERDAEALKALAFALVAQPRVAALLATHDAEHKTARLVFARSQDAPGDMNALMRHACRQLGGRGGGHPDFAQGGGRHAPQLMSILAELAAKL
jgi:alanyl-tRNA synthetase